MANRGRPAGFYIYSFYDGAACLYVGKGSGARIKKQQKRFGVPGIIMEELDDESAAFERERHWIAVLKPTENKNSGGGGGRVNAIVREIPKEAEGKLTLAEWRKAKREVEAAEKDMQRVGPRRYVARFLLTRISERNCEALGLSKVEVNRIREVANGRWC